MPQRLILQFLTPPLAGRQVILTGPEHTVGRARHHSVCLPVNSVSTNHARLYVEGEAWLVADLGSTNGSSLNEVKLGSAPVKLDATGGLLTFANIECRFRLQALAYEVPATQAVTRSQLEMPTRPPASQSLPDTLSDFPAVKVQPPSGRGPQPPPIPTRPDEAPTFSDPAASSFAASFSYANQKTDPGPGVKSAGAAPPAQPLAGPTAAAQPAAVPSSRPPSFPALSVEPAAPASVDPDIASSLISLSELDGGRLAPPVNEDLEDESQAENTAWTHDALQEAADDDSPTTSIRMNQIQEQLRDAVRKTHQLENEKASLAEQLALLRHQLYNCQSASAAGPNRPSPPASHPTEQEQVRGLVAQSLPFLDRVMAALWSVETQLGRDDAHLKSRARVLDARLALADLRSLLEDANR